jgi:plasmid maintenance system antidote protein VapI
MRGIKDKKFKPAHVGIAILGYIYKKGIKQTSASDLVKMSRSNFNLIVHGNRRLSGWAAFRIQEGIGIRAETLLRIQFESDLNNLKNVWKVKKKNASWIKANLLAGKKKNQGKRRRDI